VHGVLEAQQDLQRLARQALLALQRLIGVGIHPQRDRLRHVARLGEFLCEALGEVGLGDQPRLEVDARRQVPIGMTGPREAVDAAVFAASIGIDRAIETHVRRLVAGQYTLGRLQAHFGGAGRRHVLFPAVIIRLAACRGETVVRVDRSAAAAWCGTGEAHGVSVRLLFIHTVVFSATVRQRR